MFPYTGFPKCVQKSIGRSLFYNGFNVFKELFLFRVYIELLFRWRLFNQYSECTLKE